MNLDEGMNLDQEMKIIECRDYYSRNAGHRKHQNNALCSEYNILFGIYYSLNIRLSMVAA